jgi:hypothetical protein
LGICGAPRRIVTGPLLRARISERGLHEATRQSCSMWKILAPGAGFEPATIRLTVEICGFFQVVDINPFSVWAPNGRFRRRTSSQAGRCLLPFAVARALARLDLAQQHAAAADRVRPDAVRHLLRGVAVGLARIGGRAVARVLIGVIGGAADAPVAVSGPAIRPGW